MEEGILRGLLTQSTRKVLIITSPGSRIKGLAYWSIAVTRTTREGLKTGWLLTIEYLRKDFDHKKFALQNTPPNKPPARPRKMNTRYWIGS
jgi:hypothetical protein